MADVRLTTSSYLVLGIIGKLGESGVYDAKGNFDIDRAPFVVAVP
ncbi:hypothetical protein [Streptomyces sp. NBC_01589]